MKTLNEFEQTAINEFYATHPHACETLSFIKRRIRNKKDTMNSIHYGGFSHLFYGIFFNSWTYYFPWQYKAYKKIMKEYTQEIKELEDDYKRTKEWLETPVLLKIRLKQKYNKI